MNIVAAVLSVVDAAPPPHALHEPDFGPSAWRYVKDCLDTGWVSSAGSYVPRFGEMLCDVTGAAYAIPVVSGTAALHLALVLAGIERGDEVLVPALSFVATANAVAYQSAVPHFCDADPATLGIDPAKLARHLERVARADGNRTVNRETGRPITAVCPTHVLGHPADLDGIAKVADRFGLTLIEDAAEALGSFYRGRHVGRRGLASALSCNGNKIITTGGGGALLTDDPAVADAALHLSTQAKRPHRWAYHHDRVGYNYRMPNVNAAIGCAELGSLPNRLRQKRTLAARYRTAFADVPGVSFFNEPAYARSNYWLNAVVLDDPSTRDPTLARLHAANILARPLWGPLHTLPMFDDCPRMDLSHACDLARRVVTLPSSPHLA